MCIRKSVNSQLTGVFESPEETAAQPCPLSRPLPGAVHAQLHTHPVDLKLQEKTRAADDLGHPEDWPLHSEVFAQDWINHRQGHLPSFHVGPEASRHTLTSEPIAHLTVLIGFCLFPNWLFFPYIF